MPPRLPRHPSPGRRYKNQNEVAHDFANALGGLTQEELRRVALVQRRVLVLALQAIHDDYDDAVEEEE